MISNRDVQVAVLSMLAASTGLTHGYIDCVVRRAVFRTGRDITGRGSRARIGQKNACDIRFIIAKGSLDEHIWKMLHYKLATRTRHSMARTGQKGEMVGGMVGSVKLISQI